MRLRRARASRLVWARSTSSIWRPTGTTGLSAVIGSWKIIAIRVARLVRSVVLSAREEPYVEAAIALGSGLPKIMWRHLLPNTIAPLIVQGTNFCASAILTEAILSFLGAGISPETPTWGNIMAEGRAFFLVKPSLIFWPGLLLSITILSVNLIGDAARDALDPRMKQREGAK